MEDLFGRLIIDINGKNLSREDISLISNNHVGGIILFSRNFQSFDQIKALTNEIREVKKNIIIAVDQEGGRVQRFSNEFTTIPSMQSISSYARKKNDKEIFKDIAWLISSELIAAGIDMNFAPVLDVDKDTSTIIGDRSFSNDVNEVIENASFFIDGMHEAGMQVTGKHFPGHGNVLEDSHLVLPKDKRSLYDLMKLDIRPYLELGGKLDAVMCAHVLFQNIDENIPSYSKIWLKDILKKKLKYQGLIISDDLSMMGAGIDNFSIKMKKSLDAGCDMVLICNNRNEVIKTLEFLEKSNTNQISKPSLMKKKIEIDWNNLLTNKRTIKIKAILKKIRS